MLYWQSRSAAVSKGAAVLAELGGIVAIDGQVAAGKTAAGRELARRLGCPYLDTGIMYRAVTWLALQEGVDLADAAALGRLAEDNVIRFKGSDYAVVAPRGRELSGELRTAELDRAVPLTANVPRVRQELVRQQQDIARKVAAAAGSIVMVGRDIGTVVLPDADLKVYMVASPAVRARRRYGELVARGEAADFERVLADAVARDELDARRVESARAADAQVVDTDNRTVEQVVDFILAELAARRER